MKGNRCTFKHEKSRENEQTNPSTSSGKWNNQRGRKYEMMCDREKRNGKCSYGDRCWFQHTTDLEDKHTAFRESKEKKENERVGKKEERDEKSTTCDTKKNKLEKGKMDNEHNQNNHNKQSDPKNEMMGRKGLPLETTLAEIIRGEVTRWMQTHHQQK